MKKVEYTPYRILKLIVISGNVESDVLSSYPNSKKYRPSKNVPRALNHSRCYTPGMIVDVPSDSERALFEHYLDDVVTLIPQHKDGYDLPTSNVARSRKGSHQGRLLYEQHVKRLLLEEQRKAKVKHDKKVKDEQLNGGYSK